MTKVSCSPTRVKYAKHKLYCFVHRLLVVGVKCFILLSQLPLLKSSDSPATVLPHPPLSSQFIVGTWKFLACKSFKRTKGKKKRKTFPFFTFPPPQFHSPGCAAEEGSMSHVRTCYGILSFIDMITASFFWHDETMLSEFIGLFN